ncbi:MAG TPA: hypothetical protein VF800_27945 [Telluria sp.]|jgi:hypothetical protein
MSGTIVISKKNSFDVRNVDFVLIVNALRSKIAHSAIAEKLLETVDDFGMNMICADDLNSIEFQNFACLIREVCSTFNGEDKELHTFLEAVYTCIEQDERFFNKGN